MSRPGLKDHSSTAGRYTSTFAGRIRAFCNFHRFRGDPRAVLRHKAGDLLDTLFGYIPEKPSYGLKLIKNQVVDFMTDQEIMSSTVDATNFKWVQSVAGVGTAIAIQNVRTGEASVITGATSGNYYFYQMPFTTAQVRGAKAMWMDWRIKLSDATACDLFIGVCNIIPGGQNLFDNRANAVGFRKDSGDALIDVEATVGGAATSGASGSSMADGTYVRLGFKYFPPDGHLLFYVNDTQVYRLTSGLPSALMAVSFGIRTGAAAGKSLYLSKLVYSIEEDD